jgi:hypothetical protein
MCVSPYGEWNYSQLPVLTLLSSACMNRGMDGVCVVLCRFCRNRFRVRLCLPRAEQLLPVRPATLSLLLLSLLWFSCYTETFGIMIYNSAASQWGRPLDACTHASLVVMWYLSCSRLRANTHHKYTQSAITHTHTHMDTLSRTNAQGETDW